MDTLIHATIEALLHLAFIVAPAALVFAALLIRFQIESWATTLRRRRYTRRILARQRDRHHGNLV
jgi:hypothetical protein